MAFLTDYPAGDWPRCYVDPLLHERSQGKPEAVDHAEVVAHLKRMFFCQIQFKSQKYRCSWHWLLNLPFVWRKPKEWFSFKASPQRNPILCIWDIGKTCWQGRGRCWHRCRQRQRTSRSPSRAGSWKWKLQGGPVIVYYCQFDSNYYKIIIDFTMVKRGKNMASRGPWLDLK